MRGLAYLTPEPPRFSALGTLEVIGLGIVWGALTAPMQRLVEGDPPRSPVVVGLAHGAIVFGSALAGFLIITGGVGRIVAPTLFIVLGVVSFPLLFLAHGLVVGAMARTDREGSLSSR